MKSKKDLTKSEKILALMDYNGEDKVITSFDLKEKSAQNIQAFSFKSKIPSLDKAIDFFEEGELIIISGPRKSGKTLLAQTLTVTFLEQEIKSLWFSYELTPRQFLRCFKDLPFFVMPQKMKAHALNWIEDRIFEATGKYGIRAVFIDHLHFLFDIARTRNASLEIGQVIRFLKSLAIDLNLVIFVLCHMHKFDLDKEPTDEHFRDSSFVSQESDTAFIIWRKKNSENEARLKVCYHRRTGIWEKKMNLRKINGLLRECENER